MKQKLFVFIISILAVGAIAYGCKKLDKKVGRIDSMGVKEQEKLKALVVKDPQTLNEDKEFVALIIRSNEYILRLGKIAKKNSLNLPQLQKDLAKLQTVNSKAEQLTEINRIFKEDMTLRIEGRMKMVKKWKSIQKRYSGISKEVLERECKEVLTAHYLNKSNTAAAVEPGEEPPGCGWAFYACSAGVTAAGVLCVAGCSAGTGGIGAPACVLACDVIVLSGIALCVAEYCNV